FVETAIAAQTFVLIFDARTVVAQQANLLGHRVIVSRNGSAIAEGTEILAGIEAEAGRVSQSAGAASLIAGTVSLGGVLDHLQSARLSQGVDGVHVGRLAEQMHGHHRCRPRTDSRFDLARIEVPS